MRKSSITAGRLLLILSPVAIAAGAGGSWPGVAVAWVGAAIALAALVLADLEGSEVQHFVFLIHVGGLAVAGGVLATLGAFAGLPHWARVAAFLAPAAIRHLLARGARPGPLSAEETARLESASLAEVVVAAGESRLPRAVGELLLARRGGREALLAAARAGTPAERRGAAEAAVMLRSKDRRLTLEVARELLRSAETARETKTRALVAVWDAADAPLLEVLRGLAAEDPTLRAVALEVRARSGDARALDDWLADAALDAEATAPGFVLALGPKSSVQPRLVSIREVNDAGSIVRARVETLLRALEPFA